MTDTNEAPVEEVIPVLCFIASSPTKNKREGCYTWKTLKNIVTEKVSDNPAYIHYQLQLRAKLTYAQKCNRGPHHSKRKDRTVTKSHQHLDFWDLRIVTTRRDFGWTKRQLANIGQESPLRLNEHTLYIIRITRHWMVTLAKDVCPIRCEGKSTGQKRVNDVYKTERGCLHAYQKRFLRNPGDLYIYFQQMIHLKSLQCIYLWGYPRQTSWKCSRAIEIVL